MATLDILVKQRAVLQRITVPLTQGESHERLIYGFPDIIQWFREEVPTMNTGRLKAHQTPLEQLDDILHRWTAGKRLRYMKTLGDLIPNTDEVWEFKTADLRIFGWIYKPRIFIAVLGGYADWYKQPTQKYSYENARNFVVRTRENLDLDEPKFVTGVFDDLV